MGSGLAHGIFRWNGDVLSVCALCGFAVLIFAPAYLGLFLLGLLAGRSESWRRWESPFWSSRRKSFSARYG